jgi:hypothetical protein
VNNWEQFNALKAKCDKTQYGYEDNCLLWVRLCEQLLSERESIVAVGEELSDLAGRLECNCNWSIVTDPSNWRKSIKTQTHKCDRCSYIEAWGKARLSQEGEGKP